MSKFIIGVGVLVLVFAILYLLLFSFSMGIESTPWDENRAKFIKEVEAKIIRLALIGLFLISTGIIIRKLVKPPHSESL